MAEQKLPKLEALPPNQNVSRKPAKNTPLSVNYLREPGKPIGGLWQSSDPPLKRKALTPAATDARAGFEAATSKGLNTQHDGIGQAAGMVLFEVLRRMAAVDRASRLAVRHG